MIRRDALAFDGVERAPGGPPTAFRIWKAENVTDHGPTLFTERSAALLTEQQARRGNLFPIDLEHLSLDKEAPLSAKGAVGWFEIEVRGEELWAVNVEWTDLVRSGLSCDPPTWRYHSPAYEQDAETGEVTSLLNIALTNLPATWNVTALASRAGRSLKKDSKTMAKWSDIKAALDGDDEDAKATAYATIRAAFPDEEAEESEKKEDGIKVEDAAEDEDMKKDAADDKDEKKDNALAAAVKAAVKAAVDAELAPMRKAAMVAERTALLASRPDLDAALVSVLSRAPLATVKDALKSIPRSSKVVVDSAVGVRGDAKTSTTRGLDPEARAALDARMGLKPVQASIVSHDRNRTSFNLLTPAQAKAILAAKESK